MKNGFLFLLVALLGVICPIDRIAHAATIIPDRVYFHAVGPEILPDKPITMRCIVISKEPLPDEKVTMTKEINNNVVVEEVSMKLVQSEDGKRIYEYVLDPLPVGDYRFKNHVHYTSDSNEGLAKKFNCKFKRISQNGAVKYAVDLMSYPQYILVREDEVIANLGSFNNIEKIKLIESILRKQFPAISEQELLKKAINHNDLFGKRIEELEEINGGKLMKYKAIDSTRPR
jgi:hypothetical protein